jgi:bacterial microcompartment shell protein
MSTSSSIVSGGILGAMPPAVESLGCLETRSIALGMEAADHMLKAAEVDLLIAMPTCPGKYLIVVSGKVAAVRASVEAGQDPAGDSLVDFTVISSVHPQVVPALTAVSDPDLTGAVGIIETFSMCASVKAADEAVKSAEVHLVEIRLGRGLAGKAFVVLTGHVASVRAAVTAAVTSLQEEALLIATTVIPSPHPALMEKIL